MTTILKQNSLLGCTFVEPFAGGAGLALELLFMERVWNIVLNDADYHIYAFWQAILEHGAAFCEKIRQVPLHVYEWRLQKYVYDNPARFSLLEVGFSTFFLNRTNFSGILDGRPIGGFDQSGKWKIGARFNREALIARIERIQLFRDRITVFNLEALEFLRSHVTHMGGGKVMVYLDPPYYTMGPELYLNFYEADDHHALAQYLKHTIKHPWALSYDHAPEILALYENYWPHNVHLQYSIGMAKRGTEVLYVSHGLQQQIA